MPTIDDFDALVVRTGRPLSELSREAMDRVPQVTESVALSVRRPLEEMAALRRASERVRDALGKEGRLLIRWSGTEPKLRLMVEGPNEESIRGWARELVAAAERDVPPAA